jgi:hypothetical protein
MARSLSERPSAEPYSLRDYNIGNLGLLRIHSTTLPWVRRAGVLGVATPGTDTPPPTISPAGRSGSALVECNRKADLEASGEPLFIDLVN